MAKIEGMDKLKQKFQRMPQAVRDEILKAIPASAGELVAMQKRLAPRDKGALENSIRYEADQFRAVVMAGGTAATRREVRKGSGQFTDEAVLVEFGTKPHIVGGKFAGAKHPGTPARPFFFPAWRAMKKRIKGRLSRSITTGIKKVANGGR